MLDGATLYRANLYDADLTGSILIGAALSNASLTRATLTNTDLRGADLAGADLRGADPDRCEAAPCRPDRSGLEQREPDRGGLEQREPDPRHSDEYGPDRREPDRGDRRGRLHSRLRPHKPPDRVPAVTDPAPILWSWPAPGVVMRRTGGPGALRCGAVLAFARLVDLVGALARPLAAGTGAVPGGVQLVGNLRP